MDTIYTKNAPNAIGPYSQAVKIGDMLYTSGQIAINPATGNVEATDIVGQSKQVMANLKAVLEAAGTSFDKVVKTTCFLKDVARDFGAFGVVLPVFAGGGGAGGVVACPACGFFVVAA